MRTVVQGIFVFVAFLAALPFIVLSWMGVMRPAEGFCMENGLAKHGDPPSSEEVARSYFLSPELSHRYAAITEHIIWPVCIKSRRGEHRSWVGIHDRNLALLREPNLSRLHRTNPRTRAFRILTHASFSPLPIAFRVETDEAGGGVLHAAWLGDDVTQVPPMDWSEASEMAVSALPRQTLARRVSDADAGTLWSLLHDATPRESVYRPVLDGNWLVIEAIENGERTVRFVWLDPPPYSTGRLFCALAEQSGIPSRAIEQGLVWNPCDRASAEKGYGL